jgi:hypothetical protein
VIPLIDPDDAAVFQVDWSDALAPDVTLGSVNHMVQPPLIKISESTDMLNGKSTVKVAGAVHGGTYLVEAQTTLSNGETLNRQFPLRCFNG